MNAPVEPGCFTVIFSSMRAAEEGDGYAEMAQRMSTLAEAQPGYLGEDSVRDETGHGITVSYWRDDESARAWKGVAEHRVAQEQGRARWYSSYTIVVAAVTRSYGFPD